MNRNYKLKPISFVSVSLDLYQTTLLKSFSRKKGDSFKAEPCLVLDKSK